jgi:hypothetical protein
VWGAIAFGKERLQLPVATTTEANPQSDNGIKLSYEPRSSTNKREATTPRATVM